MRLGVLGGTFDPPHIAHLIHAEQAREQLALERILWVPAADPPHKQGIPITPIEHRVAMLRLAIEGHPAFELSLIDVQRPGPHYSVDMLDDVAHCYPGAALFFLIGADSLRDLSTWHDPAGLIARAMLVVMPRPSVQVDIAQLETILPGLSSRLILLDAPLLEISSSTLRSHVATGRTIRYMVPQAVEAYIHEHGLYQNARG